MVVVIPDLPNVRLLVLVDVPMLTVPLVEVPVPASMKTDPPVEPPLVELPPRRLSKPPLPVLLEADCSLSSVPPVMVVSAGVVPPATAITPVSEIVRLVVEADLTSRAVPPVPAALSVMTKALAVPALARVKEVGDPKPPARENAMLRPVVVVIVLPRS